MFEHQRRSIIIPVLSTVTKVVRKDVFTSKKYQLALTVLMWGLVCWGSIPDCSSTVSRVIRLARWKQYRKMLGRLFVDFTLMAFWFFVRKYLVFTSVALTVDRLN